MERRPWTLQADQIKAVSAHPDERVVGFEPTNALSWPKLHLSFELAQSFTSLDLPQERRGIQRLLSVLVDF